ncbi:MAG: hypothetical protein K2H53_01630 [Clostridia bacterium]|nr:hypothetical protein [Clostridia bacterium]
MENAAKALVIAGSILIGMIVISIFYYTFNTIGHLVGETEENTTQREIIAFNKTFEAYNKKLMYGIDIVSVLNRAIDNNNRYDVNGSEKDYYVNVKFTYNTEDADETNSNDYITYSLKNNYSMIKTKFLDPTIKNEESVHEFKVSAFRCIGVSYIKNGETKDISLIGRIKEIVFEQIK